MSVGHHRAPSGPAPHPLAGPALLWARFWGKVQRWSLTRRCLMCGGLVGARPPGESCQYCSDACRDLHRSCGG